MNATKKKVLVAFVLGFLLGAFTVAGYTGLAKNPDIMQEMSKNSQGG